MISMVVAYANNFVIGKKNDLPWYLPNDLKRFREITKGGTVIMGHNTFNSILNRRGSVLPDRTSIVISRTMPEGSDYTVVPSLAEAIRQTSEDEEAFIIGGARVYHDALGLAERLYVTRVDAAIDGDTYFPPIDQSDWRTVSEEPHESDEKNAYPHRFIVLEKHYA